MIQEPEQIVKDLLAKRASDTEKAQDKNYQGGLFHGLKVALAEMFGAVLKQIKKYTFKVNVENQLSLPEIQKVKGSVSVDEAWGILLGLDEMLGALENLQKDFAGLVKPLRPKEVYLDEVIKAIKTIKIPDVKVPDIKLPETKFPAYPKEIAVSNLSELKKPLLDLATKIQDKLSAIEFPEFPRSLSINNLDSIKAGLDEIVAILSTNKDERPVGYSWERDATGRLTKFVEIYPDGRVISEGWNLGSVTINNDRKGS